VGLARCGTVFPVSVVVAAAVPAAVCRWRLCPHCPGVEKVSLGGNHIIAGRRRQSVWGGVAVRAG